LFPFADAHSRNQLSGAERKTVLSTPGVHAVILLADDDENDLLLIRRTIKRFDLAERLMAVSDGEHVIAYLEGDLRYADRDAFPLPDVVILDQSMPRWPGLDVLLWIRNSPRFEHLPVVMLSLLSPNQAETARILGAAYCPKSPNLADLPAAIQWACALMGNPEDLSRESELGRDHDMTRSPFAPEFLRNVGR
jgi:CheY-like chemotaxis protein